MSKHNVLMIGPDRGVMGGIASVVNNYFEMGLNNEVNLYYLPTMVDGNKIKKLLIAIKAYLRFCKLIRFYDIIHIHMAAQASFDRKAFFVSKAYKAGKKIVIHQHAADFDDYFNYQVDSKKREKIRKIFKMADRVIVLSEEWERFFENSICDKEKISVLYNGVKLPEYKKHDYSNHNVLMLGRLGERKGTFDLLKAIPNVLQQIGDVRFYLAGDGEIEKCKQIVADSHLEDIVFFLGWIRDEKKISFFDKCSTYILPSHHEGMPMSVLEAMSYGLATISTNVGGIPQIIEQGVSGILISPNDVNGISSSLIKVLENENYRKMLGEAGHKRIADMFDFKNNIKKLISIYDSIS